MSIASEITRLSGVRNDIFTSITNKGVAVPAGSTFSSCPTLIDSIVTGGGGGDPTSLINPSFTASGLWSAYRPFTATQKPVSIPEYDEYDAYSGAAYQRQNSFYTIFDLADKLEEMSQKYDQYNVPSYFILTVSASASGPNSQLSDLYNQFMNDNFFNNSYLCVIGDNQYNCIYQTNYTSNKQGDREYVPGHEYAPSAVYLSAIVDLSPILQYYQQWSQYTPSSTPYGYGYSISFNGTNYLNQLPQWISQWNGSIVSSMSAVTGVTTAYPYPNYDPTTTGFVQNTVELDEMWDSGKAKLSAFRTYTVNYDSSPSITATQTPSTAQVDTFSASMMKNWGETKINNNGNDSNYTYSYGTTETAYSGFTGV